MRAPNADERKVLRALIKAPAYQRDLAIRFDWTDGRMAAVARRLTSEHAIQSSTGSEGERLLTIQRNGQDMLKS